MSDLQLKLTPVVPPMVAVMVRVPSCLHDPHSRQPGCLRASLVHPDVVAMTTPALRVIAQKQVRVHFREQAGELSGRFRDVRPREPRPALPRIYARSRRLKCAPTWPNPVGGSVRALAWSRT